MIYYKDSYGVILVVHFKDTIWTYRTGFMHREGNYTILDWTHNLIEYEYTSKSIERKI